jgi:hypothetical protein
MEVHQVKEFSDDEKGSDEESLRIHPTGGAGPIWKPPPLDGIFDLNT